MKRALSVVLLTLLTGCSGAGKFYWGWHCEGDPRTGEWDCEQRLLRDGQPVDESLVAPEDMPPAPALAELGPQPTNPNPQAANPNPQPSTVSQAADTGSTLAALDAAIPKAEPLPPPQNWRDKLPGLDGSSAEPAYAPDPVRRKKIGRDGPVPTPETYSAPEFGASSVGTSGGAPTSDIQPVVIAPTTVQKVAIPVDTPVDGFTLQLAALDSERHVEKYLVEHQLPVDQLQRHQVESNGRGFYVLTMGQYENRQLAEQAGLALQRQYPQLSYWVRSLKSLRQASGQ